MTWSRRSLQRKKKVSVFWPAPGLAGSAAPYSCKAAASEICINALSLAKVCGFPLLMIVTMRGEWGEMNPWQIPMGQITGKTLQLAGVIVYEVTKPEAAAPTVEAAARICFNGGLAVAILLSQRMLGTKLFKD